MFEPFGAASTPGKVVNILILLFIFLSWVSTMVTFSRPLHKFNIYSGSLTNPGQVTVDFYWDHASANTPTGSGSFSYSSDEFQQDEGGTNLGSCKSGGEATLAFAIFAFLAFLIHIPLAFCRVAGLNFPLARDTQHSLYIELVLTAVEFFCFFLQVTIWGGSCFSKTRAISGGSTSTSDGFAFMLAAFFFLIFNFIAYFMMRTNENLVMGNGASRGGSSYGGGGGGDGDYGGGESSQPTFSYQANASESGSTL